MHLGQGFLDRHRLNLFSETREAVHASQIRRSCRRQACAARAATAEQHVGRQAARIQASRDAQAWPDARDLDVPTQSGVQLPSAGFDRTFTETYKLGQPLGAGSFKTVFVGRDRRSGQRVAVQVIAKERGGTTLEHNIDRIKKEVEITRMLQARPETCRLLGVYEDNRNVYMVSEMCDGGTLEQFIQTYHVMPEHDAVLVVTDVLNVLAECNKRKVCYADVKPANLLLKGRYPDVDASRSATCPDAPPDIRVIDFGCSQLVKEGTKLEKRTGTPLFLPPEMFMRHWGPEADLWSLGMVTYLLLSGKMPFWGGAASNVPPLMVMQEILGADIKFDGPEWEGISDEAIDFVDKLLDRDYNTRMTAEQALQHPWIVSARPEQLEECSLQWGSDHDDDEYNVMTGGNTGRRPKVMTHDGPACSAVLCSIGDGPPSQQQQQQPEQQ